MDGVEYIIRKVVWYAEIGYVDGCGMGIWRSTIESHPFTDKDQAEKLRDEWLASGKLNKMHWGELRPTSVSYGAFRIRRAEEIVGLRAALTARDERMNAEGAREAQAKIARLTMIANELSWSKKTRDISNRLFAALQENKNV